MSEKGGKYVQIFESDLSWKFMYLSIKPKTFVMNS